MFHIIVTFRIFQFFLKDVFASQMTFAFHIRVHILFCMVQ